MRLLIISLVVGLVLIGSFSCSPAINVHETERLKKLESALAPYVLPAKFDEERVEHLNLRNERISKLAEILEPHDIKLQVSERPCNNHFILMGCLVLPSREQLIIAFTRSAGAGSMMIRLYFGYGPEFGQALQKKYERKWALSLLVERQKFQISQIEMGVARLPMKLLIRLRFWRASRKHQTRLYFLAGYSPETNIQGPRKCSPKRTG